MALPINMDNSFIKRHVVAALVLPVLVLYLYYLPPMPWFFALILIAGMTAMAEFCGMYEIPARLSVTGVIISGILLFLLCSHQELYPGALLLAIVIVLLIRLFTSASPSGCMSETGPIAVGFLYIAGLMAFQWYLRTGPMGVEYIFLLYTSVWLADGGALYVGTSVGRNKLCPTISPNKTWEGAGGSVAGGIAGALLIRAIFDIQGLGVMGAAGMGAVLGITAMTGDLIESMFKRDAGVKDSGGFLPGHGGMLDKLDGMLVSGPVLYFMVSYL